VKLYKWLNEGGQPAHGGRTAWSLPNGRPGKWRSVKGELVPCENGLHLCREQDLVRWCSPVLWEAEYRGELIEHTDKVVVREARLIQRVETWNEQTARLFAADCAEVAMGLYGNDDERAWAAILTGRRYAFGLISADAARSAADAAGSAANAAWSAADAAGSAADATWSAADAAGSAANAAYTHRLMEYLNGEVDLDAIKESVGG